MAAVVEYSPVTGDPGDNGVVAWNVVNYIGYITEAAEQVDVL